jgi:hypothetical protein
MSYCQLIHVSSYINEYGTGLPAFLDSVGLGQPCSATLAMTLFFNGSMIQLIEGTALDVRTIFHRMQHDTHLFSVTKLTEHVTQQRSLASHALGINGVNFVGAQACASTVPLFKLCPTEVMHRVLPGVAQNLLVQFARDCS